MATATNLSPADVLAALIARGVARYQESLPDFARDAEAFVTLPDFARPKAELPEPEPIITLNEERQRDLCLNCPLADCVGIETEACPIRVEQRAAWRRLKEVGR
jgi:hypothetical protein